MIVQLIVAVGSRKGQVLTLSSEKFIIGRSDDCHLKSKSELVSRYHCAIIIGHNVIVRDLGSKNGVRINGEKINNECLLQNGDHIVIGPLEFYVQIIADAEVPDSNGGSPFDVNAVRTDSSHGAELGPDERTVVYGGNMATLAQD